MKHRNLSNATRRLLAIGTVGLVGAALLASGQQGGAATGAQTPRAKACHPADDAGVIADWNHTAVDTLITDAVRSPAESYVYFGFTHAAMHNAVNGITREYKLYKWSKHGPRCASPEAAAASAAYHLLYNYFSSVPAAKTRLDAAYAASLNGISDGWAEDAGVEYGERAAQRIIDLRANDGRYAPLAFTKPPGPGVWRPTSDPPVPFSTPWLSQMKPMVMKDSDQFRPGPPPALESARYAREYNEVKDLGAEPGSTRSPEQTTTAKFFSDIGVGGLQAGLRDLADRHGMNISDSARLFAVANVAACDAFVAAWDAKFHYGFWRPITAIRLADTDGNDATDPDTSWTSLIPAPPYPDYTSGLNSAVGSVSRAVARVLGTNKIDLFLTSAAAAETRHYRYAGPINHAAIDARVWSGLHFRTADVVGNHVAQRIATLVFRTEFRPAG
jgi:hypothetical protein